MQEALDAKRRGYFREWASLLNVTVHTIVWKSIEVKY